MRILRKFPIIALLMAVGGLVLLAMPPAKAGSDLALTESVKQGLMAAQPVRGAGVERETFDGKPVLVIFFASW